MTAFFISSEGAFAQTGYLGPAGSWTHQACLDLYGDGEKLVPMTRDDLFSAYSSGKIDRLCVPVTTSVVGVTPYLDEVLSIKNLVVIAEYPKMLGYSLLAKPGATKEGIKTVVAHPVALEEVKPWLDKEMPHVTRKSATSGGAAAQEVANGSSLELASMGPKVGASIYGLDPIVNGIEEGPHNVTRWWVLGRDILAPTGHDKTSLLADVTDSEFAPLLADFVSSKVKIIDIYERPSKKSLDAHSYLIEVDGHAEVGEVREFLMAHKGVRLLGSYARKY